MFSQLSVGDKWFLGFVLALLVSESLRQFRILKAWKAFRHAALIDDEDVNLDSVRWQALKAKNFRPEMALLKRLSEGQSAELGWSMPVSDLLAPCITIGLFLVSIGLLLAGSSIAVSIGGGLCVAVIGTVIVRLYQRPGMIRYLERLEEAGAWCAEARALSERRLQVNLFSGHLRRGA